MHYGKEFYVKKKRILAIISDHGFGHAARSTAVLQELLSKNFSIQIYSAVPEWFFIDKLQQYSNNWEYIQIKTDVGLAQKSSVEADYEITLENLEDHWSNFDKKVDFIVNNAKLFSPEAVYFDLPAIAPEVAKRLEIPSIGMANFSWDWIYQDLIENECDYSTNVISDELRNRFIKYRDLHKQSYRKTSLLLTLPFSGDFSIFPNQQEVNWVGHHAEKSRQEVLKTLKLPTSSKYLLLSFGGNDLPNLDIQNWQIPDDWSVLVVGHPIQERPQLYNLTNQEILKLGIQYSDIIKLSTVIVTKPGYGIITDAIFNNRPVIHVERGQFAEYPFLLQALENNLPHQQVDINQLVKGEIFSIANTLSTQSQQHSHGLDGANQVSEAIINLLK